MVAVMIFVMAWLVAMGAAAALADTRFHRLRFPPGRTRGRRAAPTRWRNQRSQMGRPPPPTPEDERALVAEIEEWIKRQHHT